MSDTKMRAPGGYAPKGKNTGEVKPKGTSRIRAHHELETIALKARKPSWLSSKPSVASRRNCNLHDPWGRLYASM